MGYCYLFIHSFIFVHHGLLLVFMKCYVINMIASVLKNQRGVYMTGRMNETQMVLKNNKTKPSQLDFWPTSC